MKRIKNISFPKHDKAWVLILDFIKKNYSEKLKFLVPVEFCKELENSFPYEWSYWSRITDFDCLVIHKGLINKLKNNYLQEYEKTFDYVFGNEVFNIFLKKEHNKEKYKGDSSHFLTTEHLDEKGNSLINPSDKNILLVTANNNGNIGDDAITLAAYDLLQETYPDAKIHIDKAPANKQLISQVSLVVIGGGGVFYDNDFYNAQNYCQYFLYAHEAQVKSCAFGVGALGRRTILGNILFKHALDKSEFIIVRDKYSKKALEDEISTNTPVFCKQDIAFTLNNGAQYFLTRSTKKPLLLFSLIDMKNRKNFIDYQQQQIECMQLLVELFEVKLLLHSRDDFELYQNLSKRFNLEIVELDFSETRQVLSLYQQCDLIITARLHAFIFAVSANVPVITVSSQKKASKLDILINDSIPSCKNNNLNMHKYNKIILKKIISNYFNDKSYFIANPKEVLACKKHAIEIKDILESHLNLE